MLTEAEKKWLEERRAGLCVRCAAYDDCPMIKSADFRVETCYRFRHEDYTIEKGNFEDAAEFEARVAARMTGLKAEELPCYPNFLCPFSAKHIGSCKACYLKYARLAVESEMEQEGK